MIRICFNKMKIIHICYRWWCYLLSRVRLCDPMDCSLLGSSVLAQTVKHLPAMRETRVRSLGWEDPLVKEMATHSSILTCKIPWTEDPGRLQSMGLSLQARIVECVAFPFSRGSSQLRDWTQVSRTADRFFAVWVTREAPIYAIDIC